MPITDADIERGRKLRAARTSKKISQSELSRMVDGTVSQPYISFYEQGDPRYPFPEEKFKMLMSAIKKAAPASVRKRKTTKMSESFRVHLPIERVRYWESLDITGRTKIVLAGLNALEADDELP